MGGRSSSLLPEKIAWLSSAEGLMVPEGVLGDHAGLSSRVEALAERLDAAFRTHSAAVIVLSEAVRLQSDSAVTAERVAEALAKALARRSDDPPSVRTAVVGYELRGVPPTAPDRELGLRLATAAVDQVAAGRTDAFVAWRHGRAEILPLAEASAVALPADRHGDTESAGFEAAFIA
jgi:6-phosphofructokinase